MRLDINADTRLCAVIGNPVAHSLSPAMHNAAFRACELNYVYLAFQVGDVAGALAGMRALAGFRGLSVTIPHKVAIMPHLDEIEPLARQVGSVNTVVNESGRLVGAITDGLGTLRAFERAGITLDDKQILFLGTGGAARAVAFAVAQACRPRGIRILGRTEARMRQLTADLCAATKCPIRPGMLASDLRESVAECDVIIQATPVGMYGHAEDESVVPAEWLRPEQVVFDMVYRPMRTRLIQDAEHVGCATILGLEMLLFQAVLQFEMWTGLAAPEDVMRKALTAALNAPTGHQHTIEASNRVVLR